MYDTPQVGESSATATWVVNVSVLLMIFYKLLISLCHIFYIIFRNFDSFHGEEFPWFNNFVKFCVYNMGLLQLFFFFCDISFPSINHFYENHIKTCIWSWWIRYYWSCRHRRFLYVMVSRKGNFHDLIVS